MAGGDRSLSEADDASTGMQYMKRPAGVCCEATCHCGKVRFKVRVPATVTVRRCNCSICAKIGYLHLIVAKSDLEWLSGQDELREYRFNTGLARHLFCRTCGIKPCYVPRSHPEGYSVNFNCLQLDETIAVQIEDFDGRHWRRNVESIRGT